MLEKLVLAALGKDAVERMVRQELERLEQGKFLDRAQLEALSSECLSALASRAEQARGALTPALTGLASHLREALDLPSRAEVVALTEALARAEKPARAAGADAPAPEAGVAAR